MLSIWMSKCLRFVVCCCSLEGLFSIISKGWHKTFRTWIRRDEKKKRGGDDVGCLLIICLFMDLWKLWFCCNSLNVGTQNPKCNSLEVVAHQKLQRVKSHNSSL
jgi:hypothetical protein